jgi:transcriptional regulator of arginine metabolism
MHYYAVELDKYTMQRDTHSVAPGSRSTVAPERSRRLRQAAIRRIVARGAVESQERLTELLRREGFSVTQATLSRDLKGLGIGKTPTADGGYRYAFSDTEVKAGSDATFVQDFKRGFLSIEFSGNFGLMKTLPGHASSVASALDNLRIREVLGTVAGDDTILVVPRTGVVPAQLEKAIRARIPSF